MRRIGIIGLGEISKYYRKGLEESSFLKLTAVCDLNENAPSRSYYENVPFYTDYIQMINEEKLEYVIISTNPISHYQIVKNCLQSGICVITEKPAVLSMEEYDELQKLAHQKGVLFEVMYHFQTASEMKGFKEKFDPNNISSVEIEIKDPYSDDGKSINEARRSMCGAWLDSGVNALSMVKCWLNFDNVELIKHKVERCQASSEPIFVYVNFLIDGVNVEITVDWRTHTDYKYARVIYDGKPMVLDSTAQKIVYDGKVYDYAHTERLQAHYYNYFKNYKGESDKISSRKIHDLLLFTNDVL